MDAVINENLKGYEIRERIGTGGFGAVYRAYQTTVGREVAIKVILPGLANQPDFIRRFEGEAQLVARLEHPHITPLYDYWRDPDGAYLVMRWLRGGSLRDALQNGPFELRAAALLLDQVAGALSLAHRRGVIHRDIKPGNILIDEDGNAYLTDFGIAKDLNVQDSRTAPDAIVGSLDYLSPEQARGEPITARTDIYSLGVTLFEMITGHHPFQNVSSVERLYKHINDPLPEITTLEESISDAVNRVIQKATAKNPEGRYADALGFAADFHEAAGLNRTPTQVVELLTQREHEILHLIIAGMSNKEIAQKLTVALSTVKWYVKQIYDKLGVRSRVQAMVRARELNLLMQPLESADLRVPTEDFHPENPYKGLRAFESADYQDFFGREKVTAKLVKRLSESGDHTRFLAVVGPSGSGKSSLVKAGLIPALWRGDLPASEKWFVLEMLPGAHPLDELEIALTKIAANQANNLHEHLERDARGLVRTAQLILPNDGSELVLVIDQFEELFTMVEDEQARTHFLALLYAAVTEARSRVRVIITLRADFYDRPLHYAQFGELVRSRLETLLPLTAEELERAIAKPAERAGAAFEPGLVSSIVADVNYQPGALPLLQFALAELFEHRQGRLLTREAYEAIGKTVGALAKRAEEVYLGLDGAGQEAARQMFLRLVTLGEGTEDTRRRTARSELLAIAADGDLMDEVIDTFASYRLLALDNDPGTRTPTVEVAHEALLREWERLRMWLEKSRDDIRLQRQLGALAAEWREAKQNTSYLAHGSRLEQFTKWATDTPLALTPDERAYLDASAAQHERETKAEVERQAREQSLERRSQTFQRVLMMVLVLATLGAFGLTGLAVNQSNIAQQNQAIAERNAREAQNVALVSGSQAALATRNTDLAIALALEAVKLDPLSTRAQLQLSEAAYAPGTVRLYTGHSEGIDDLAISPDGRTMISASLDHSLILWDIETGAIIRRFEGHSARVSSVSFTPDGRGALSSSHDTSLILWDVETGEMIRRFEDHTDEVRESAMSPDGQMAVSAGADKLVILWDLETGEVIHRMGANGEGHTGAVGSPVFSPDGQTILTPSEDGTMILWDVATGDVIRRFNANHEELQSALYVVAISPDGRTALTDSDNSQLVLWDVETGQVLRRFSATASGALRSIAFIPDGSRVLTGYSSGVTILWDVETGQPMSYLQGHGREIDGMGLSADGRYVFTGAGDNTIRRWDLEQGQFIRRFQETPAVTGGIAFSPDGRTALFGYDLQTQILWDTETGEIVRRVPIPNGWQAEFSPDGRLALTAAGDPFSSVAGGAILWNVSTGQEVYQLGGDPGQHTSGVDGIAFSPDGRTAVSCAGDGLIILWDVATGQEIRRFIGHDAVVGDAAFSPDGSMLVSGSYDGEVILWDVAVGAEIRRFGSDGSGHTRVVTNVVFSEDGRSVFTSAWDSKAIQWDVSTGAILRQFEGHSAASFYLSLSPRDELVFVGSADNTSILWDIQTGDILRRYTGGAYGSDISSDGQTLVVSFFDGRIEVWRIDSTLDELLTWTRANRYIPELTCDQRELYRLEPLCAETTASAYPTPYRGGT